MGKDIIKLNIQSYDDRQSMVQALANSGYSVRVEEITDRISLSLYYVVFDPVQKGVKHE